MIEARRQRHASPPGLAGAPTGLCEIVGCRGADIALRPPAVALAAAARTSAKYVGLLGSKRKIILIYEDLMQMGIARERIRELRAPIGLDMGARTPEEIAVSIMSEVVMFRLGGTGSVMKLEERLMSRIEEKHGATVAAAD